ncbi:hypothetical protein [Chitinophaga eiseniae]|uniref:hypothetical protein n=1 Tax=Chitinophaga eiseniae TaxID=634771 RepID=UPI0013567062|nr:hypothetical protein [Chitinophaga eiseniae]
MLSRIIAAPVTTYLLQGWLQRYEYRVNLSAGILFITAWMAMVITIAPLVFSRSGPP